MKNTNKSGKKMFFIIASFLVLMAFIISIIFLITNVITANKNINEKVDAELALSIEIANRILPEDYNATIINKYSINNSEYLTYVKAFDEICLNYDLEYLWSIKKDEDGVVRFTSSTSINKKENLGYANFYDAHSNPESYEEVFKSNKATYTVIEDEWGNIKALLVPFKDKNGETYIIGASKTVASIDDLIKEQISSIIYFIIISFIIAILVALIFSTVITSSLKTLLSGMNNISKGHYGEKIELSGFYEQRQFTSHFNIMSQAIHSQISKNKQLNQQLNITLESIGDGVIATDAFGKVTRLNKEAERLTGWLKEDALGKDFSLVFNIINESTKKPCENIIKKVLAKGEKIGLTNHTLLISKNGNSASISDSAAPILNSKGEVKGVVIVFRDNTEENERINEIIHISHHDKLTGLSNRLFLEKEIKKLNNKKFLPISILIGDVNGLKMTNDIFGHAEGDKVLKAVAKTLRSCIRKNDVLARWGGDEFVILLSNTEYTTCEAIGEKIRSKAIKYKGMSVTPTISIGYATTNDLKKNSIISILETGEEMMYRQKLKESSSARNKIIQSLENTLGEKYFHTAQHSHNVKELCLKYAKAAKLNKKDIDQIILLARLHDIGKIAIDDSIIMKKEKLTNEDWEIIKQHPVIGYRIANSISALTDIAEGILHHHENWNGQGYPDGLKGEDIPYISRILSVVDSYDVMMSERPYKEAMSKSEAIAELERCSGTQFDSSIVELFLKIIETE